MRKFGRSRLRKGISIVAAMVLLLNPIMPTVPVFATEEVADWNYIFNESSWIESYENGVLKDYYVWADGVSPYKEDLWNTVEGRAANWNDIEKENGVPIEYGDGYHYANCVRNWLGAKNAPEAVYPWVAVELPKPFEGKIKLVYDGGTPYYFPGEHESQKFTRGFYIESVVTMFGDEYLINGSDVSTFDPTKLVVTLIPVEYEAQIGETNYATIGEAIAEAGSSDTVKLLKDITVSSAISINKEFTLDLNGHSIKQTGAGEVIRVTTEGNLTINDGGTNGAIGYVDENNPGTSVHSYGTLTLNGGIYKGNLVIYVDGVSGEGTINGGDYYGLTNGNVATIYASNGGNITITNGNFNGKSGENVFDGVNKEGKVIYAGANYNMCEHPDYATPTGGTITVEGGYFIGRISHSNGGTYVLKGGNFDRNAVVKLNCSDGITVNPKDCNGTQPKGCEEGTLSALLYEGKTVVEDNGRYIVQNATYAVTFKDGETILDLIPTTVSHGSKITLPSAPEKAGYTFDKWYKESTFDNEWVADTDTVTQATTIYAKYNLNSYTITYELSGGTNGDNPASYTVDTETITLTGATKSGFDFGGWFKDSEFAKEITGIVKGSTGDLTLHARWNEVINITGGYAAFKDNIPVAKIVVDDNVPAADQKENDSKDNPVDPSEVKDDGYSNPIVKGGVEIYARDTSGDVVTGKNIIFTVPFDITEFLQHITGKIKIKAKHHGSTGFTFEGLVREGGTCSDGVAISGAYNGEELDLSTDHIYTCQASTFVAYTETANTTPSTFGGGGGGKISYSCKKLPANAIANNTTTPKKNTDYSYSTDTGAVCTFQCKSGYTRNEKDAKCEKADGTVDTVESDTSNTDVNNTIISEDLQKILEDGYTVELHRAYEFAFKHGVTTMPSVDEADMYGPLTRIAMAKMLSQYAINVLGKTPDTTKVVPTFPDMDEQLDKDYNNGVTLAYQLGIMGINIEEFRPFDNVTRAEFVTALSRLLFGTTDGEGLYYETHMQRLLEEKIIAVTDPDMLELRGYVMIMLMRSK